MYLVPIDFHQVAQGDLIRGQQVRQGIDDMPFDGALQVARAVTLVRAFLQKEVAPGIGHSKEKLAFGGVQNPLLHLTQLDIEHFLELLALQRVEYHHFIEAVHEFGRKLTPRRF